MKSNLFALAVLIAASFGSVVFAQDRNCPDGSCPILQTVKIPAEAWNALVDLSQDQKNQRHDQLSQTEGTLRQTTLAKVRNQTGVDLDRFSIVALGAPIITPAASPDGDRALVDAWAEKVGISNWYVTVPKS